MLAKICEGIPDALSQLRDTGATFLAEYKYDGQRAQIHMLSDGLVCASGLRVHNLVETGATFLAEYK